MKKKITTIILIVILLAGLSLLLYPTVSDYWNSLHQSRAIANYVEYANTIDKETYNKLHQAAEEYNKALWSKQNRLVLSEAEIEEYNSLLNISGTGIMGYIDIPQIECELPIYHGTSESVLQIAIGHIEGTSLPIGGNSTHCVLSGHRGLPSAKLFTDLDKLIVGDIFMLQILDETLTYEVDQIHIVEPQELDDLDLFEGKDYCTLVTCTPYGINTHRLLVRGHRIENIAAVSSVRIISEAIQVDSIIVAPIAAVPMFILLLVVMGITGHKNNKTRKIKKKANRELAQNPALNGEAPDKEPQDGENQ